jgi:hypothetical protein
MQLLVRAFALGFCVLSASPILAGPAEAARMCHNINAKGVGQDLGGGMTRADVIGGGLLQGKTVGSFVITSVTGSEASISGTVVFTTNNGGATASVAGTFNVSTGVFSADGPVSDSTGKLSGASGDVSLVGLEQLADGSFREDITGTICLP